MFSAWLVALLFWLLVSLCQGVPASPRTIGEVDLFTWAAVPVRVQRPEGRSQIHVWFLKNTCKALQNLSQEVVVL